MLTSPAAVTTQHVAMLPQKQQSSLLCCVLGVVSGRGGTLWLRDVPADTPSHARDVSHSGAVVVLKNPILSDPTQVLTAATLYPAQLCLHYLFKGTCTRAGCAFAHRLESDIIADVANLQASATKTGVPSPVSSPTSPMSMMSMRRNASLDLSTADVRMSSLSSSDADDDDAAAAESPTGTDTPMYVPPHFVAELLRMSGFCTADTVSSLLWAVSTQPWLAALLCERLGGVSAASLGDAAKTMMRNLCAAERPLPSTSTLEEYLGATWCERHGGPGTRLLRANVGITSALSLHVLAGAEGRKAVEVCLQMMSLSSVSTTTISSSSSWLAHAVVLAHRAADARAVMFNTLSHFSKTTQQAQS
eukprot:PhM_4_TR15628/c2_g1_i2/m.10704